MTGNLASVVSRTLTFSEVQAEIGRGAPVGTRVGWFGGGGHFQTIVGWLTGEEGTEYLDVSDPIYLDSQVAYADFASAYQSGGDWTHSYFTQPSSAGGAIVMAVASSAVQRTRFPDSIGA